MERLSEFVKGYSLEDVLNMDELELFFRTLSQKGLAENKIKKKEVENKVKRDAMSHCSC